MKRSQDVDFDALFDSLRTDDSDGEEGDQAGSSPVDDDWDDEDDDHTG
jgi:hypothetical protein